MLRQFISNLKRILELKLTVAWLWGNWQNWH